MNAVPCCQHCDHMKATTSHPTACLACLHDAANADVARVRAELRDRLDRCEGIDFEDSLRWLAHNHPDLVNEALDETGAPS